jgi:tRNA threonylcarbamoyladenosine biosynthesis protein TsaE
VIPARLADEAATEAFGRALAPPLSAACRQAALVVYLEGPLGAGKTTLARGLLRGLGHAGRVRSPSFTLLEPYELAGLSVAHLDLYRLAEPGELDYLGLADLLSPGSLLLVEWPERGRGRLPGGDLRFRLDYADAARTVLCEPLSPAGRRVLATPGPWREPAATR